MIGGSGREGNLYVRVRGCRGPYNRSMAAAPCRNAAFRLIALPLFAAIVSGCWENDPPPQPPKPESNWTLDDARSFDQFPLYWLGANYEGMPLTLIRRRQATSYTPPPTGQGMATPDY